MNLYFYFLTSSFYFYFNFRTLLPNETLNTDCVVWQSTSHHHKSTNDKDDPNRNRKWNVQHRYAVDGDASGCGCRWKREYTVCSGAHSKDSCSRTCHIVVVIIGMLWNKCHTIHHLFKIPLAVVVVVETESEAEPDPEPELDIAINRNMLFRLVCLH